MYEQMEIMERMRKRVVLRKMLLILVPIILVTVSILLFKVEILILLAFLIFIVLGVDYIVYLIFVRKPVREYRQYYKNYYVSSMIRGAIPTVQYQPEQGFPSALIAKTGLIMMGNIYHSEDLITGYYNNVEFRRADVLIQNETQDSEGHSSTTTYFKGRWMIFESNKYFEADLQIIQNGFGYARKRSSIFTRKEDRRHAFQTEDVTFNSQFKCLCQNESEAFYLLTPVLMQGLMKLAAESDGKIMVGFVDNLIHVAIKSNKDSLEPPIYHSVSDKDILGIQREINAVTSFVEGLKIDRKIFMQNKY